MKKCHYLHLTRQWSAIDKKRPMSFLILDVVDVSLICQSDCAHLLIHIEGMVC